MTAKPIPKEPVDHKTPRKDRQKCLRALRRYLTKRLLPLAACLVVTCAQGASVTLAWYPNPETNIVAYIVHYGTAPGAYSTFQTVSPNLSLGGTNVLYTVTNLPSGGRFYFAVTALNALGVESTLSAEVSATTPVSIPAGFRVITNSLQGAASPQGPWTNLASYTFEVPSNSITFYRGKLEF
jgi:hypothetical protein